MADPSRPRALRAQVSSPAGHRRLFIVDFYCASARLALELDGGVHDDPDQRAYDAARRDALASHDVRVLRLDNRHVHEQMLRDLLAPYARPRPDRR